MNDPSYFDVNNFVDSLHEFDDFGVFGDVASIDFADVGIDSNETDKADEGE